MWNALRTTAKAAILFLSSFITTNSHSQAPEIGFQPIISSGITEPIEVHTAPGDATGRLFIVEKDGVIRVWNGTMILPTPYLDISSIVADDGERGLLSMAFHPQFQSNGFFYLYHNNNAGDITVARYTAPTPASNTANSGSRLQIFSATKPFDNHNGAHLQFRVEGGVNYLYFATGDGGSGNDPNRVSQNQSSFLGKMIRMDVDAGSPTPQIWAWGLRNPFRWSFDRATGDMYIGDVGQGAREEVSFRAGGTFGANYGWPCFEASLTNSAGQSGSQCDTVNAVDVLPIFEYPNPSPGSSSVIGGYVYRGTEYPSLQGYYITGDFYTNQVWLLRFNGTSWDSFIQPNASPGNIVSYSETANGSTLYGVSLTNNIVYKIVVAVATPVTLVSFSGKALSSYNELKWTTASEQDLDKYIIEYSSNGRDFISAGEVIAIYAQGGTYTFTHTITGNGDLYYRLKMLDKNGTHTFSPVISLGRQKDKTIKVYPTVVTNNILNIESPSAIEKLSLFGPDGRSVFVKDMNNVSGYFTVTLPSLSRGVYYLRISGREILRTEKIIIQ